ncbi:MAG: CDGSH iron-sulfur domain-containing protein [Planctomycetes bacterium]|nr:CDGSH iron-sulfur domain-containing protein [Planctomycetota bacterium]
MARLVRITANRPIKIEPSDKPVWICACGLSQKFPFCDGHHKQCDAEQEGTVYAYDDQGANPQPAPKPAAG